eukprot:12919697-Prorocentrum_lima.AAC.1
MPLLPECAGLIDVERGALLSYVRAHETHVSQQLQYWDILHRKLCSLAHARIVARLCLEEFD